MTGYLVIHLLGVVLFSSNTITGAFWKFRADRKKDLTIIHNTVKNVMLADWVFTFPGLIMIIISGNLMAYSQRYSMQGFNWLTSSLNLFAVTGAIWIGILIPLQIKMIRLSKQSLQSGRILKSYRTASFYRAVFGTLATLFPVGILCLMVTKPF